MTNTASHAVSQERQVWIKGERVLKVVTQREIQEKADDYLLTA